MEPDQTPPRPRQPTAADTSPALTEAELSRIAREAVRQPADPRLDKQLERMGLTDAPPTPAPLTIAPVGIDRMSEVLERRLRRVESIVWVLVAGVVILAVAVIVLLLR